jgi:hypothetical protein
MTGESFLTENDDLSCEIILGEELILASLVDRVRHKSLLRHSLPFCLVEVERPIPFVKIERETGPHEQLVFSASRPGVNFELSIALQDNSLRWQLVGIGSDLACHLRFPFLAYLDADEPLQGDYAGSSGTYSDYYSFYKGLFREQDFLLPAVWMDKYGRTLTFLVHQTYGETVYPVKQLWEAGGVVKNISLEKQVLFSGELILHDGGLQTSFEHFRRRIRAQFDLSQYQREDLDWTKQLILQHFTFLYGREILDLDSGQFNIERLLDEGESSFGGYDGLILWGTYPRMGVDERTQWDYYDDYPGGRRGLRELGEYARTRGARIFIPYKPWDHSAQLHGHPTDPDEIQLARLVRDIDADGVFLDCMSAIDGAFRQELDEAKPGVSISSEGRAKGEALQTITSGWEQSQSRDWVQGNWSASKENMPVVDLWRFIFPEHRLFVISRFTTADDRKRIIQRGFFNGMGWVVWQDVFGLALPFTPDEAALLKKCRTIFREYQSVIWGAQPTPFVPVLNQGVYCNEFQGDVKRVWILYNSTGQRVQGPLLPVTPRPGYRYRNLWQEREIFFEPGGYLPIDLEPYQVGAVVEQP